MFMICAMKDSSILALEFRDFFDEAADVANQMVGEISSIPHNWYTDKSYSDSETNIKIEISDISSTPS